MNAVIGTIDTAPSRVVSAAHPPIVVSMEVLANSGVIADGQLVALDAGGKVIAHTALTETVGVNINVCDTAESDTALVIKHGTVNRDLLLTGADAASDADIAALEARGIFAV